MTHHKPDIDSTSHNVATTSVKRREAKLPSVKSHLVRAFGIMVISASATALGFHLLGDPNDAKAVGEVGIDPLPLPAAADSLVGTSEALPDLLAGEVPKGVNPTDVLDALGNPLTPKPINDPVKTAETPPAETIASLQTIGPKTILIDGKPLGGITPTALPASALPRAPFDDIVRNSPNGRIPKISQTGRKAVTSYARPFTPAAGKKQVAIIIGGLGIDRNLTRRIINETPSEVTLSFAAHANGLQTWIHQARDKGHEVMIELPMESQRYDPAEPGADKTLKSDASAAVNIRNLDWLMSRAQGYFAVTNYGGDKLLTRTDALAPVLAHLSDAGLGFIYDGSGFSQTVAAQSAASNLPFKSAFSIIDSDTSILAINTELTRLEAASQSGAPQIGIGFALPETTSAVKMWIRNLDSKGLELAPASYVLNR